MLGDAFLERLGQAAEVHARGGRDRQRRQVAERRVAIGAPLREVLPRLLAVRDQVPLVVGQQHRAPGIEGVLDQTRLLALEPGGGVHDQAGDVGALERVERAQRGVELGLVLEVGLAADAGGVHQHELAGRGLPARVHRVHRGAGPRLDDHARLGEQGVHDRRRLALAAGRRRQPRDDLVEQVADPEPALGGDRDRLAEAEAVEVVDDRVADLVHLVHDHQRRAAVAAQALADREVEIGEAALRVHQEHHQVGEPDRDLGLAPHVRVAALEGGGQEAAGVHQHERAPRPLGGRGVAVARDAGPVVDHRSALAQDTVEERRFADVGTSDDRDDGSGHAGRRPMPQVSGGAAPDRRRVRGGEQNGAGNGVRTRDLKLGKLALYQLSYARNREMGFKSVRS